MKKKKFTLKTVYHWLHLWVGMAAGLLFSVVAFTGSCMVFQPEIDHALCHDFYYATPTAEQAQRLPLDSLFTLAKHYAGDGKITRITIEGGDSLRTVQFISGTKKEGRVFLAVNPYSGALSYTRVESQSFFYVVENIHRFLLMEETGRMITGAFCLGYLLIFITGLLLWLPKNRRVLAQRLRIKWDASRKRLNWDVHAVFGFYTMPVLFIIALTGLAWSYDWFENGIFLLFDGKPLAKEKAPGSPAAKKEKGVYQNIYTAAYNAAPARGNISIDIAKKETPVRVIKERVGTAVPKMNDEFYFNSSNGSLISASLYEERTIGYKARRLAYPIHTGSLYGLPTKLLVFFSCLVASSLPYTGFYIWWGKRRKKRRQPYLTQIE